MSKIYKMRIVLQVLPEGPRGKDFLPAVRQMILSSKLAYVPAKINAHWPRLSYGPSIGKGQLALREYIDIYLKTSVPVQQVQESLAAHAPQGIAVLAVHRVPYALASLQQLATAAVYEIEGNFAMYAPVQTLENYVSATRLESVRRAANSMSVTVDIKPFVRQAHQLDDKRIECTLVSVEEKWMNPLILIYAWLGWEIPLPAEQLTDERFKVIRQGLYWKDSNDALHQI